MSRVSYPFNLNINSALLSDWFFGILYTTCVQGTRLAKKKQKIIPGLLGKGKFKNLNIKNAI